MKAYSLFASRWVLGVDVQKWLGRWTLDHEVVGSNLGRVTGIIPLGKVLTQFSPLIKARRIPDLDGAQYCQNASLCSLLLTAGLYVSKKVEMDSD